MSDDKSKLKRSWEEQAVNLALRGHWQEAVAINEKILSLFPEDADACNRLGKAYTELGQYAKAREAYSRALQIDPFNTIAQKNLQRLSTLTAGGELAAPQESAGSVPVQPAERGTQELPISPRIFIEAMGKTGTTTLVKVADQETLARVTAGSPVLLEIEGNTLVVRSQRGERLGEVEPKLGKRLIKFIQAGNRYTAAIMSLDNHSVRVLIRETYQHPSMAGRVSFPPKYAPGEGFRAYTKESVLRYEEEEEEASLIEGEMETEEETLEEAPEENDLYEEIQPEED